MQKKFTLFYLLLFCLFYNTANAQVNITASSPTVTCDGPDYCIDLTVTDFTEIANMQWEFRWDTSLMTYIDMSLVINVPGINLSNQTTAPDGYMAFSISSFPAANLNDGDVALSLCFSPTGKVGTGMLSFADGASTPIQMGQGFPPTALVYNTDFFLNPGTITVTDLVAPMIDCLTPDITVASNTPIPNLAPTSFSDNCLIDSVSYVISGATNLSGLDDASGSSFNLGMNTVTYTVTDFGGNTDVCSFNVEAEVGPSTNLEFIPLITFDCDNDVVVLNMTVNNFIDLTSIQYTPEWDTADIKYDSHINMFPPAATFIPLLTDDGQLPFFWSSINPITLNNGDTIFSITFDLTGNLNTPLFDYIDLPTLPIEIFDDNHKLDTSEYDFLPEVITITDTELPTFGTTCPMDFNISNATDSCGAFAFWDTPFATDDCDPMVMVAGTYDPGDFFPIGATEVLYTATDDSGNTATCTFIVTVADTLNPTILCPPNVSMSAGVGTSVMVPGLAPSVSDNCAIASITFNQVGFPSTSGSNDASGVFNLGTTTVTYTVTDENGLSNTCSFDVTITNMPPPNISCPASPVIANAETDRCDEDIFGITPTTTVDPGAIDSISYTLTNATTGMGLNDASGIRFNVDTTTVTYTLTDTFGQVAFCSFDVIITDVQLPNISCPTVGPYTATTDSCNFIVTDNLAPTTSDNCAVASVSYELTGDLTGSGMNDATGLTFPVGTTNVTYTVTDVNGNTNTCALSIVVSDDQDPTISCPIVSAFSATTDSCNIMVTDNLAPTTSDNCGVASVTYELTGDMTGSGMNDATGLTFPVGSTDVTYTVTDASGNSNTCSITVTVSDDQLPNVDCASVDAFDAPLGDCEIMVTNNLAPTISDNCGIATVTYALTGDMTGSGMNDATGLTFPVGTTNVTYTVTDVNGNSNTCALVVQVNDVENPSIVCPMDTTVIVPIGITSAVIGDIDLTASDNCGILSETYSIAGATPVMGSASNQNFPLGTTEVKYYVEDVNGNLDSCSFNVTVNEPPTGDLIDCPGDLEIDNDPNSCTGTVTGIAPILLVDPLLIQSIDFELFNINGMLTGMDDASGQVLPLGITTIRYIATNMNDIKDSCIFTVTVNDVMDPIWSGCPDTIRANVTVDACEGIATWNEPIPSDNCGISTIDQTHMPSTVFPVGETTVTYTAFDASGNSAVCSFIVIIEDNQAPTVICPTDFTYTYIDNCKAIVNWVTPTAMDNCPGVTLTSTLDPGDTLDLQVATSVIFLAIDDSGLTGQCTFPIMVPDTIRPTIMGCPSDTIINTDPGECSGVYTWIEPSALDNCVLGLFSSSNNPGDAFPLGETIVTYTATDQAGNTQECSFKVTVIDNQAPTMVCPGTLEIRLDGTIVSDPNNILLSSSTDMGCGSIKLSFLEPTGFDNCAGAVSSTLSTGIANGESFPLGTTTQTYQVQDTVGLGFTCSFDIIVLDLAPVTPTIIGGNAICLGSDAQFAVTPQPGATYAWSGPGSWTGAGPTPVRPQIDAAANGIYTVVCTTPEGCTSSGTVELVTLEGPEIEASSNSPICTDGSGTLQLMASPLNGSSLVTTWAWTGPAAFSTSAQNPIIPNADNGNSGTYTVIATSANGCTDAATTTVEVIELAQPSIESDCAETACVGQGCFLLGTDFIPSPDTYHWEVSPPANVILSTNTNSNEIAMEPTVPGILIVRYWVSSNGCSSEVATIEINVSGNPEAVNDQEIANYETPIESNVLWNDNVTAADGVEVMLSSGVSNGQLELASNGVYTYTPGNGFLGDDQFTYQVCSTCDPTLCSTAVVTVSVAYNNNDCEVPTVITPNNDGLNDVLFINCVYDFKLPKNSISIYNEWGDRVFEASPYLNNWDGTYEGAELPDGTYFFVFKADENADADKGSVTIFR